MPVCDNCHRETNITYTCFHCRGKFCIEHRRPELHNCPSIVLSQTPSEAVYKKIEQEHSVEKESHPVMVIEDEIEEESPVIIDTETIPQYDVEIKDGKGSSFYTLILVALLVISLVVNGFLYLQYLNNGLNEDYIQLYNSSVQLQAYYDNLTNQYNELRQEYSQLNNLYLGLVSRNSELEQEYNDILGYNKSIQLVKSKSITLKSKTDYSETFVIPFSGYIFVNYTATGDTYAWIGSTNIENGYYSRNPQFPQTASDYNFTVPVLPNIMIYFANPNEFQQIEITYSILFIY